MNRTVLWGFDKKLNKLGETPLNFSGSTHFQRKEIADKAWGKLWKYYFIIHYDSRGIIIEMIRAILDGRIYTCEGMSRNGRAWYQYSPSENKIVSQLIIPK